jgi:hypothetical protein
MYERLCHHHVKRIHTRTNKNNPITQMTRLERRETQLLWRHRAAHAETHSHHVGFSENDPLPYTDVAMHHRISESKRHYQDVFHLQTLFPNDPASKVRHSRLVNTVDADYRLKCRTSFPNCRTTSSAACSIWSSTVMNISLQMRNETQSASLTTESTRPRFFV